MVRVDAHMHAFASEQVAARERLAAADATFAELYADPRSRMADSREVVAAIADAGLDWGVVAGFAFRDPGSIALQNQELLAAARDRPGELTVLAAVNPASAGWRTEALRTIEGGARGFGELRPWNQGWDPLGPEGRALCGFAEEAGAVLLWHVSEPVGHSYPGKAGGIRPEELWRVAEHFPALRMVAAHLGGGLPFFLQMPEVRHSLANTWFDTAAVSLLYHSPAVARVIDLAGPHRVLFGSDYPLLSPKRQFERVLAELRQDHVSAVCGDNAHTLFRG